MILPENKKGKRSGGGRHHVHGCIFACLLLLAQGTAWSTSDSAWMPLFNGTDLADWDIKIRGQDLNTDPWNTFFAEDGLLRVDYSGYTDFADMGDPYGHIAYKVRTFSHYLLRVEYRFSGPQAAGGAGWAKENNGIMFHSQAMSDMGLDQDFPNSIEVQLLGTDNNQNSGITANLCTPGTYVFYNGRDWTTHCTTAGEVSLTGLDWVHVDVLVLGDSAVHFVEGQKVFEYSGIRLDDGTPLTEGYIALQSESAPADFRRVDILNLEGCMDAEAANFKDYYVADDPASCEAVVPTEQRPAHSRRLEMKFTPAGISIRSDAGYAGTVMDARGNSIMKFHGRENGIHSPDFLRAKGIYFVEVLSEGVRLSRKWVKL